MTSKRCRFDVKCRPFTLGLVLIFTFFNCCCFHCCVFLQSFQSQLPWAECPQKYFLNGSYVLEPECVVSCQCGQNNYAWTTIMDCNLFSQSHYRQLLYRFPAPSPLVQYALYPKCVVTQQLQYCFVNYFRNNGWYNGAVFCLQCAPVVSPTPSPLLAASGIPWVYPAPCRATPHTCRRRPYPASRRARSILRHPTP